MTVNVGIYDVMKEVKEEEKEMEVTVIERDDKEKGDNVDNTV